MSFQIEFPTPDAILSSHSIRYAISYFKASTTLCERIDNIQDQPPSSGRTFMCVTRVRI